MKVGFLTLSISRKAAGLLDCVRQLALHLHAEQQISPEILSIADEHSLADGPLWQPLSVNLFAPKGPANFGYSPDLPAGLRDIDADVVHVHGLWTYFSVIARRWSTRSGRPRVVSTQGMLDPWALRHSRWKKRIAAMLFERANLNGAACLHAVCAAEAAAMRAYGLRNPICVIPNGVDLPPPQTDSTAAPPWREDLPAESKVLLYLSRLHPKKGLESLLRAWADARRENRASLRSWYLIVAGWDQGGYGAKMLDLCAELNLKESVRFVGPLFDSAKTAAFRYADAFVLPSFSEGLPLVVLEAWSHGLPVIMTEACNLPEGYAAGAAVRAEPEPASLAIALTALLGATDAERRVVGARGRALVEEKFTWTLAAQQMREVYDWLSADKPRPGCVQL